MSALLATPQCCGSLMRELLDADERPASGCAWICRRCHRQHVQGVPALANSCHASDPRLRYIRKRSRRRLYEVRIYVPDPASAGRNRKAGGGRGNARQIYIGDYRSVEEAIVARDAWLQRHGWQSSTEHNRW